ncbi:MAG: phosphate ABC transporter substrate-binding protein [Gammaproteobacteria bacterium]|nr:phosphate ABC transporter substrate-binding protein [Gammaproteobacteria bacterium]
MTGKIEQTVGLLLRHVLLVMLLVAFLVAVFAQSAFAADARTGASNEALNDDIVVIVSSLNTVKALTRVRVEDIFLGRMQQFPNGQRAVPIDQAEGSAVRGRFNKGVLGHTSVQVRIHWSRILFTGRGRPPRSVASNEDMLQAVAADVHAIGYIERRFVNDSVAVVFE